MHDMGGSDVPVVFHDWDTASLDEAMNYWVELSQGRWTDAQRDTNCACPQVLSCCLTLLSDRSHHSSDQNIPGRKQRGARRLLPCWPQLDLLIRLLLSDESVGYVPPFIVFWSTTDRLAQVLFTLAEVSPPPSLIESLPRECENPNCSDPDCNGLFDTLGAKFLSSNGVASGMIRQRKEGPVRVQCNNWICTKTGDSVQRCQRCKQALYCSQACQVMYSFVSDPAP